jgi:fused signal recognition particle receptor
MLKISSKWNQGLVKTHKSVWGRISQIFKEKIQIDDRLLEDLEEILIEGDVGVETSLQIIEDFKRSVINKNCDIEDEIRRVLKKNILKILNNNNVKSELNFISPVVILVVGVNGTGKTTTIGKMANMYRKQEKKVLIAAADTFRAAANEQLEVWAKKACVDIVRHQMGSDPAAVAYDALNAAVTRKVDILIIDTAGRLHTKVNLMEELKKVCRVLKKGMETAPHEILLVLDATTGQNGLSQANFFSEAIGITGIALTKLDGTARGGIVIAINKTLGIPVKMVGVGEGLEDLIEFDAESFVEGLLGMDNY